MKKLILLLSVLSIFLIPSFSFASYNVIPSDGYNYYVVFQNTDTDIFTLYTFNDYSFTSGTLVMKGHNNYTYDSSFDSWTFVSSVSSNVSKPLDNYKLRTIKHSNFDVQMNDGTVFFSPLTVPLIQVAEELPPVILQHGGTVLLVALTGFGLLLVVSLIPLLVKRFLY